MAFVSFAVGYSYSTRYTIRHRSRRPLHVIRPFSRTALFKISLPVSCNKSRVPLPPPISNGVHSPAAFHFYTRWTLGESFCFIYFQVLGRGKCERRPKLRPVSRSVASARGIDRGAVAVSRTMECEWRESVAAPRVPPRAVNTLDTSCFVLMCSSHAGRLYP